MKSVVIAILILTGTTGASAGSVLYAPSEPDDAGWRSAVSGFTGEACDYLDTRSGTPTLAQLLGYDLVFTYADYAYADATAFGNVLADYVDAGGRVLLGQFCLDTDQPNALAGRILGSSYVPFSATTSYLTSNYSGDGTTAIFSGVNVIQATFVEDTSLNPGFLSDGTFLNGHPFVGWRPDGGVFQATGLAVDFTSGDTARLVANISDFQPTTVSVPLPASAALLGELLLALSGLYWLRRRRS